MSYSRSVLLRVAPLLLAGALFMAGCGDEQPVPSEPAVENEAAEDLSQADLEAQINRLLNQLFPAGPQRAEVNRTFAEIKDAQEAGDLETARGRTFGLVDTVLEAGQADELEDPRGSQTADEGAVELVQLLFEFVGLEAPPLTTAVFSESGGAEVVDESGGTVTTSDGQGGVEVPEGAFPDGALVTMERQDDPTEKGEGPLPTDRDQFPPFYDIEASSQPDGDVSIGTCVSTSGSLAPSPNEGARLQMTKTVTGDPSSATVLAQADAGFLDCGDDAVAVAGLASGFSSAGASATPFTEVAMGEQFGCGLLDDGSVWCWGENSSGQLGNGTTSSTTRPDTVETSESFVSISAGARFACGRTSAGDVYCWGRNFFKQLGDGTTTNRSTPVKVAALDTEDVVDISTGHSHSCARTTGDRVFCWGRAVHGQLGHSMGSSRADPQEISSGTSFVQVDGGVLETCGLKAIGGTGQCWGDLTGSGSGPFVDENPDDGIFRVERTIDPTPVSGNHSFEIISAGAVYGCGLTTSGVAWCWGINGTGKLGDGTDTGDYVRVDPQGNTLLTVDGTLEGTPNEVVGGHVFDQIAAHDGNSILGHTCAIDVNGAAWCWGSNSAGELGTTTNTTCGASGFTRRDCSTEPVEVGGNLTWSDIDVNVDTDPHNGHSCGVTGGDIYCWGENASGQLGDGTTNDHTNPREISAPGGSGSVTPSIQASVEASARDESPLSVFPAGEKLRELIEGVVGEG